MAIPIVVHLKLISIIFYNQAVAKCLEVGDADIHTFKANITARQPCSCPDGWVLPLKS